jgi:hypothetical protein
MRMEMFMKAIGKMIKQMDMENTLKKMVLFSKELGRMISNMEKELKFGEIRQNMREIILKGKNMVKDFSHFLMAVSIKVLSKIISLMEKVLLDGRVAKSMLESG